MRASATSRIAPSANLHPSQAKADANKADEASPFALLLGSVAPSQAAKPDKKDARDSDEANGKAADDAKQSAGQNTQPDNNSAAPVAVQAKSGTDKPEKSDPSTSDKDDDSIAQPDSDPQSNQISAADPQPPYPQTLTSVPAPTPLPVLPEAIAAPSDNDAGRMPIDPAAPTHNDARDSQAAAAAAAPAQISAADRAAQASADSATAQASAAAAMASAAPAATQAPSDPLTTQAPAASVAAAPTIAPAYPATSQTSAASAQASITTEDADDAATQIQGAAQTPTAADTRAPATKTDTAKPLKTASNVKAVPADDSKTDATKFSAPDKTEDLKPNIPDAASNDTPKPAPQPAANNSATGIASPPPLLQSGAAPAITQHVQVTAQPMPNLPALAVTIAAKSQSGARQFDIRLDPPELGRVDVRLSIDASGKTSAHLSADQPQTLHLLQKDASVLTRALRDAGLNVAQDGLNFSLRQQAHDGGAGNHSRGASRAFSATATISIDATAAGTAIRGPLDGRLDIRV